MPRTGKSHALVLLLVLAGCGGSSTPQEQSSAPNPAPTKQWFQGGTLHNATVKQWKAAAFDNRLATAGDWLSATKWKGHLTSPADFDRLKSKAQMLVDAVDKSVSGNELLDPSPVNQVAAAIMAMSNDLGP